MMTTNEPLLKPSTVANILARVEARERVPVRLQVAVGDILQIDVIVESGWEAETLYSRYANLKNARGKAWGGAASRRADLEPAWTVKVGAHIRECCEICTEDESNDRRDTQPIETCEGHYDRLTMCAECRAKDICPCCLERLLHPSPNYAVCSKVVDHVGYHDRD